ncbi:hypothetical protein JYB88_14100 [Shewanella cyperi]|uniref:Uncharacterized protein n=1 Tax=Shewanella cyperi TaxID=2814292 RepID=A0A974XJ29_9GAMM|nr:hypothetical protein [Shewanella cyperi]QSX29330.1 hypothetical protein JYB88_14100 [Shewanella cyperi]
MSEAILFYPVFLSQILLISLYFPRKIVARCHYIFNHFPATSHPKLYPAGQEKSQKGVQRFWQLNLLILLIGALVLVFFGPLGPDTFGTPDFGKSMPLLYGMLQFAPIALMELSGLQQFKLMRQLHRSTSRKAELQPRRLFDFISPTAVTVAVLMFFACLFYDAFMPDFRFQLDVDTFARSISLILCNLLFIFIIHRNLRGRKVNPLQASEDRYRQIQVGIKSLIYTSIAVSTFVMINISTNSFALDRYEILFNSLYWQAIALLGMGIMLNELQVKDIDFNVYKAGKGESPAAN